MLLYIYTLLSALSPFLRKTTNRATSRLLILQRVLEHDCHMTTMIVGTSIYLAVFHPKLLVVLCVYVGIIALLGCD